MFLNFKDHMRIFNFSTLEKRKKGNVKYIDRWMDRKIDRQEDEWIERQIDKERQIVRRQVLKFKIQ